MRLTTTQENVLRAVAEAGALTSRRVQAEYGPRPHWYALLTEGYLQELHTLYGKVLVLGRKGRPQFLEAQYPRVSAPGTAADRAYLNDALRILLIEGYAIDEHEYQRASGQIYRRLRAAGLPGYTDVILSTTLQVPASAAQYILEDTHHRVQPLTYVTGFAPDQLGHPKLYASIRTGGISLSRLKELYKRHRTAISCWHHPLLVAVPEPTKLDPYVRALERQWQLSDEDHRRHGHAVVRLIHVPVPARV